MTALNTRLEDLSNSKIIERCFESNRKIVGGVFYGNLVIQLSDEIVVKFGWGLTVEEADNQRKAYELLDPNIIRVPRVYRYFTQPVEETQPTEGFSPRGFIVMEYVHGDMIESPNSSQINQIAQILAYFARIHRQHPGPLHKGASHGLLWQENGTPAFQSVQQMERWLNYRLPDIGAKLSLQKYPLVMCHLDLAPRNILWLKDGSICLLDWESAGFYPRFFEVSLLKMMEYSHGTYETTLMERMERLTEKEEAQMLLLMRSFYSGIKYSFVSFHYPSILRLDC